MDTNTRGVTSIHERSAVDSIPAQISAFNKTEIRAQNKAREERVARATRKLHDLLETREELRGVYAPADQLAETLRWSA